MKLEEKFNEAEIARLNKLDCVKNATSKVILFTREFKIKAVGLRSSGAKSNREIFSDAGIDGSKFARRHFDDLLKKWSREIRERGEDAFIKHNKGGRRKQEKKLEEMSMREISAKIKYLEAENEFLKKLKALRR